MRSVILITLSLFVSSLSWSADRTAQDIIDQREFKTPFYRLKSGAMSTVVINMQYGESHVISNSDRRALQTAKVGQIDLVFTDFPKGKDLRELNLNRIRVLQSLRRSLVTDKKVRWRIIRQTGCKNESEAKTMFHGIVVHYRPKQSKETTKEDLSYLDSYMPDVDPDDITEEHIVKLLDTTVVSVLNRNKDWKQMTIVSDLTGSMAPYTAQLGLWFQLNIENDRVKNVLFFNDGDMKPFNEKRIGQTGGIYSSEVKDYDQLRTLALKTVSNGNGGDWGENDCEALIEACNAFPNAEEIILIADNIAPIKDISLLHKINKPVRVILCGTNWGINTQYLNIARATGGSVHTMHRDLENLIEMSEGKTFKFQGRSYKIIDNEIVEITRV